MENTFNQQVTGNIRKYGIWVIIGIYLNVIMGLAITDGKWIYYGLLISPVVIYLCIVKSFIFPVGLYALLLPFDSILSVTGSAGGATATKFLGILSILVLSLKGLRENKLRKPNRAVFWCSLLILYGLVSIFWAVDPGSAGAKMSTILGLSTLYVVASCYKIEMGEFVTLKYSALLGALIAALYTIYNYTVGSSYSSRGSLIMGERITDPNIFAFTLLVPLSICVNILLKQNRLIMKCLYLTVLFVLLLCLVYTGSRGGLLGAGTIFIVYFIQGKRKLSFMTLIIIAVLALMPFVPSLFSERMDQALETGGDGRTAIWHAGVEAINKYWLFGAGLNNFPAAYDSVIGDTPFFKGYGRAAHNIYIGILTELGICGFSLLILSFVMNYKSITTDIVQQDSDHIMLRAAFWGILVSSFFLDTFWTKSFWFLWMMISFYSNALKNDFEYRDMQRRSLHHALR